MVTYLVYIERADTKYLIKKFYKNDILILEVFKILLLLYIVNNILLYTLHNIFSKYYDNKISDSRGLTFILRVLNSPKNIIKLIPQARNAPENFDEAIIGLNFPFNRVYRLSKKQ